MGLNCALRAVKEHMALRRPGCNLQFELVMDDRVECIHYTEDISTKSNNGGLKHTNVKVKVVMVYPAANPVRFPVRLFKKYLDQLPTTYKFKDFYLQANKQNVNNTVKRLATACSINGHYTNHSLRHTSASSTQ